MPVSTVGIACSRIAPAMPGTRIRSPAAIAGAQRRAAEIGASDGAPNSAGSEAASTVTKLSP